MSTSIDEKRNQRYTIDAVRYCGGKDGMMVQIAIDDSVETTCIALSRRDAIDFCAKIIISLNEIG